MAMEQPAEVGLLQAASLSDANDKSAEFQGVATPLRQYNLSMRSSIRSQNKMLRIPGHAKGGD